MKNHSILRNENSFGIHSRSCDISQRIKNKSVIGLLLEKKHKRGASTQKQYMGNEKKIKSSFDNYKELTQEVLKFKKEIAQENIERKKSIIKIFKKKKIGRILAKPMKLGNFFNDGFIEKTLDFFEYTMICNLKREKQKPSGEQPNKRLYIQKKRKNIPTSTLLRILRDNNNLTKKASEQELQAKDKSQSNSRSHSSHSSSSEEKNIEQPSKILDFRQRAFLKAQKDSAELEKKLKKLIVRPIQKVKLDKKEVFNIEGLIPDIPLFQSAYSNYIK